MRAEVVSEKPGKARVERTSARASMAQWILLLPSFPPGDASTRVKIWRQLQKLGAVALKNAVYVLPNREECVEAFQWVSREIAELGGQASLCEEQFFDGITDQEIEQRFAEARNADFAELATEARALLKALRAKRLSADKVRAITAQSEKLERRVQEVVAIDFGHAAGRTSAEGLVTAVGRAIQQLRGERESGPIARVERPQRATWVTRSGVHIDRIASAWLIRRFVDPRASFKFVPPKGYQPKHGELRFDMYDAEFTHIGDRCTFEVLLLRMGLAGDAALAAIGDIVHDIDLRDEKHARPETIGVESALSGLCTAERDDETRIATATPLFDGLYEFFSGSGGRR